MKPTVSATFSSRAKTGTGRVAPRLANRVLAVGIASSLLFITGCAVKNVEDELGYKPEARSPLSANSEIDSLSSQLVRWMKVEGEVTEEGASETPCGVDGSNDQHFYSRHFWSIYDLTKGTLGEAMSELRDRFHGPEWELTKDGRDGSKANSPELRAINRSTGHKVFAVWRSNRSGGNVDLINFIVESRCYEAPRET
ncbi:hypothetical protein JGS22_002840 [Streptomyces sp. P38-E01]|uniref:Uncharacterized protein n=1 Tax=Streptomyces tardus TaxID=2780544 RepID=A0A949N0E6_9ACTN|nr:hypothetical protein [Streptomyces tardus]MBU7596600.1 hypothetical protein [Streptomyces tardus]